MSARPKFNAPPLLHTVVHLCDGEAFESEKKKEFDGETFKSEKEEIDENKSEKKINFPF